ncbi:MAG: hypothetical protein CMJ76_05155 [Planctomycetaceae bacterium]|nr:hypothetical protein [Planctomycetaceae bacterium]
MMQGNLFNDGDHNELDSDATELGDTDFQSEEPEVSDLEFNSSFQTESEEASNSGKTISSEKVLEASVEEVSSVDTAVLEEQSSFDPELVRSTSEPFINQWEALVSQTNWQKGEIIHQWRAVLIEAGAPVQEYSDESWAKHLNGTVSGQHVGRLRRVFQRFGDSYQEFDHLSWTHFQAAVDWSDAEMWLEGALQNKWSVSSMREQRWEAMGGAPSEKPDDKDVIYAELDEDFVALSPDEAPIKNDYTPGNDTIRGEYDEASSGPDYASGSDFGDTDPYGMHATNRLEPAAREFDGTALEVAGDSIRPFENLEELPSDLQSTLDEFKIAILRHKSTGWQEVDAAQVSGHLYALIQMVELPGEKTIVPATTTESQEEASEDDIAPF